MRGAIIVAALLAGAPAAAQEAMVKEMAGAWQILPVDGSPGCTIQLTAARAGNESWRAVPATDCADKVPDSTKVVAWKMDGDTLLLDAAGKPRMTFVEDETALPTSPDLANPKFYLVRAIAGYSHIPQAQQWGGAWRISRKAGPACTIVLDTAPQKRVDISACPKGASVVSKLRTWSLEDLRLMLWGQEDQLLAFSPAGNGRWTADGDWSLTR